MFDVATDLKTNRITIVIYDQRPVTITNSGTTLVSTVSNTSTGSCSSFDSAASRPLDLIEDQIRSSMVSRWAHCITGKSQFFEGGAAEFRTALIKHSLFVGFEFKFERNNDFRIKAVCKFSASDKGGCPWLIQGSGNGENSVFFIKQYISEHTCGASAVTRTNRRLSSHIVSEICLEKMRFSETYSATDLRTDISLEYGFDISYTKAWHAVDKENASQFGEYRLSYEQLRLYCVSLRESNPGSHIIFETDNEGRFLRVFIALHACVEGFAHCRPLLFCDSTFLKGRYKGQMFSATAKDGNQQLFQLAFAIVNSENNENWEWFFRQLNVVLKTPRVVTFVSDRHPGLVNGVATVFPNSPHGYCTEHLKGNLRTHMSGKSVELKDAIKKLFNKVIFATDDSYCKQKMDKLKAICGDKVIAFLDSVELKHYSDAYFEGERYGEFTSNAAESLNAKYVDERAMPLLGLVDCVRVRIMTDMASKRDISSRWSFAICPVIDIELRTRMEIGRLWVTFKCNEDVYEVRAKRAVMVDLAARTCSCKKWQIHKMPCAHALAGILKSGKPLVNFIDFHYLTCTYKKTYALPVFPVPTLFQLPSETFDPVHPPVCKAQPGRRKKARIASTGEPPVARRPITCSSCNKVGHNSRYCKEKVVE